MTNHSNAHERQQALIWNSDCHTSDESNGYSLRELFGIYASSCHHVWALLAKHAQPESQEVNDPNANRCDPGKLPQAAWQNDEGRVTW